MKQLCETVLAFSEDQMFPSRPARTLLISSLLQGKNISCHISMKSTGNTKRMNPFDFDGALTSTLVPLSEKKS